MKGIWRTNPAGGPDFPDWKKLSDRGVTDFYVPAMAFDPSTGKYVRNKRQVNPTYRRDVLTKTGYRIYRDPSWNSILDGQVLADVAFGDIVTASGGEYVPYMYDIEYHSPKIVIDTIKAHRRYWPKGPVAWTLEPWQAGWFTDELVDVLNNDINLVVVVQNFFGNMTPAGTRNGKTPAQELLGVGISTNRVKVFYDGQKPMPSNWDGCILSEERI